MSAGFSLHGLPEVLRRLEQLGHVDDASASALLIEGEAIMTDSKSNYVPVKQGVLRASGTVQLVRDPSGVAVELGYGGAASDYALVQHERLDFNHPRGGQAKYLERPFMKAEHGMAGRLAANLQRAIERLVK